MHAEQTEKDKTKDKNDDSSESEGESEPAKSFHRRVSTNKEIKTSVSAVKRTFFQPKPCGFLPVFSIFWSAGLLVTHQ